MIALLIAVEVFVNEDDSPLHEQIADSMYHSYTAPKLEYLIEKYGDEFVATEYGSILSTRFPNFYVYLAWSKEEQTYQDDYIVYLRKESLENILSSTASPILGKFKLFVDSYGVSPSYLGKDSTAEDLLKVGSEDGPIVQIHIFTTKAPEQKEEDMQRFAESIQEQGYSVSVTIEYLSEENFHMVNIDNYGNDITLDENFYKYWGSARITPEDFQWRFDGWEEGKG